MAVAPGQNSADARQAQWRIWIGRGAGVAILILLLATVFLISPHPTGTRPGVIPWADSSALHQIIRLMSFGGRLETARGVEVKDLAFHAAAVVGLVLLALRSLLSRQPLRLSTMVREPWCAAQVLLLGWVALSYLSALWSGAPGTTLGQATLYALALAWALAVGWTACQRDLGWILGGIVAVSAAGALLTVWYFFERNPHHRPGFPLGNPGVVAAMLMPAILIVTNAVIYEIEQRLRGGAWRPWLLAGCIVVLLPLLWAFHLADALAAKLGLVMGLAMMVFLRVERRTRWIVVVTFIALLVGGIGYRFSSGGDLGMGRSASARFRLYTWRYATVLWQHRALLGFGAGEYPRLANELSIEDELLDPAAFMAPMRGHAHNELFEVLAEIGLVGGVTFVAGHMATFVAALALLRRELPQRTRVMVISLLACLSALALESMGSVSLRLPGVPALFFTLIGLVWMLGRSDSRGEALEAAIWQHVAPERQRRGRMWPPIVAAVVMVAAFGAGYATLRNWSGVRHEQAAWAAARSGELRLAHDETVLAEQRLFDPVRRIGAGLDAVQYLCGMAGNACDTLVRSMKASGQVDAKQREAVIRLLQEAYAAATDFDERVPRLGDVAAWRARCAERLEALYAPVDAEQAHRWRLLAEQAWNWQRRHNRYDVEALLALMRYTHELAPRLVLLRDALRMGDPTDAVWLSALRDVARERGFEHVLNQMLQAAGPIDPKTDVDAIVASMAPEAYRLSAAWRSLRGDNRTAAEQAARAARLYLPLRARFPELYSRTLSEQAAYEFLDDPGKASAAVELMDRALAALPVIQIQQLDALARPFRLELARYLLAAGDEARARTALSEAGEQPDNALPNAYVTLAQMFVRVPPERRPADVTRWLRRAIELRPKHFGAWSWLAYVAAESGQVDAVAAVLKEAESGGVPAAGIARIRQDLGERFPDLREQLGPPE
ncbi:MAG: O-antigen ligase family protein [Phycisphaerae bacterium]|nr:O-antigen ligase family protein [Phycisphaerae bacterium]